MDWRKRASSIRDDINTEYSVVMMEAWTDLTLVRLGPRGQRLVVVRQRKRDLTASPCGMYVCMYVCTKVCT